MQARGQLRLTWRLYAESPQSGEISRLHGQESIEEGDLSTQSIMGAIPICLPCRHAAPLEMTVAAGTIGHTFGVRVDGTSSRRFLRFLSLTGPSAPRVVDCPSGNAYKVSVTGLAFSVIWHDKHSGNWLTAFATPYLAVPLDTPSARGFRGFKGWWWRPSGAIIIHGAEPRRW